MFAIVLSLALWGGTGRSFAVDFEDGVFTDEEREMRRALNMELYNIEKRAYILPGTRLYLYYPYSSEFYNINSLGFRGPEPELKAANGYNIMVVGASTVFGDWTKADHQTIPALLESLLRERYPDRPITVYNLGMLGYEFQREIELAGRYGKALEPDLVLFYHGGNNAFRAYSFGYQEIRPFSKDDETELLKMTGAPLYRQMRMLRQKVYGKVRGPRVVSQEKSEKNQASFVKGYLKDARKVNGFFKKQGVPVIFVLQPLLATRKVRTPLEENLFISAEKQHPAMGDFYAGFLRGLRENGRARDLSIYDFTAVFDDYQGDVFFDVIHVNLAGNRIIAQKLFDLIQERRLIEGVKK